MINKNQKLLKKLKNTSGKTEFYNELKKYFDEHYAGIYLGVIKLVPFPPFYLPVSDTIESEFLKEFSVGKKANIKNNFFIVNDFYVYPFFVDESIPKYILVFNNQINNYFDEIKNLCDYLNDIFKIVIGNYQSGFDESALLNANLVSQMSHDINSMISLIKTNLPEIDDSVSNKLNYAEKMTKDILQYVREIHILDSEVEIRELLDSIVDNVSIPDNIEVSKNFSFKSEIINIDVELIDKAIKEIIQNSIISISEKAGKIGIKASIDGFNNLFFDNKFLVIIIEDDGSGINPDFLQFVKNPFFTTWKSEYHSGLGLSIANKIIEAYGGFLSLENSHENATIVTIYLPMQGKGDE